jgi:hypothetical protein
MSPMNTDPELLSHFTVAVYPFVHDLTAATRAARLAALDKHWAPWWTRLSGPERGAALEATAFFLPYVRSMLYPEVRILLDEPPGPQYAGWAARLGGWCSRGLARFDRRLPGSSILHLTLRDSVLRQVARFRVDPRAGTELPGRLDWVDALLFPSGIGFLLLKVRLDNERARLAQLIELNRAIRLVHPLSVGWSLPELCVGSGTVTVRDLMNFLTQGLVGAARGPFQALGATPAGLPYTDTEPGLAYGERCQLLSYACIHLTPQDQAALPAGAFPSGEERLLFEYATNIGLGQSVDNPMWVPSAEQAERLRRDNRLALWRCWKAMALKESCVFLGTEDIPFNRRSLPHVLESNYLPLYLYVLHQKVQLMIFANDLMHEVAQVGDHLRGARALLRRFVAFRNRFWFNEVTRKPQGGDLYRLMQQSLDIPGLYEMALASVKEAKEYYEDRWDRHVRFGLTLLGLGGPVAAAFGAARTFLQGLPLLAASLVLAAAALGGLWALRGNQHQRSKPLRSKKRRTAEARLRLLSFPSRDTPSAGAG